MDKLQILPINHALQSIVDVPGSKSLTNRTMMIAALADGRTSLTNALFSDDSLYFADALKKLDFEIESDPDKHIITVTGRGGHIPARKADLFVGNAGTAARFLCAFLTLGHGEFVLDGDNRMRERPIGDLLASLSELGANLAPISSQPHGADIFPPIRIIASGLPGGRTSISGEISSQYLSALLMVAPYAEKSVEIRVSTELSSKPYVDMTLGVMENFGIKVIRDGYRFFSINSGCYKSQDSYSIEPDASAASYFFAAAAILGGTVRINNLSFLSKQGDIAFVKVLQRMGCSVKDGVDFIEVSVSGSPGQLRGVSVDMSDIPDTAQTLAVVAPFASSVTHIRGIASARAKECDRVSATCCELSRLGVRVIEHLDGMSIYPCNSFRSSSIKTYNDHRMAMAFALIGLRVPGVSIENPGCVSKTFPNYFNVLETLR